MLVMAAPLGRRVRWRVGALSISQGRVVGENASTLACDCADAYSTLLPPSPLGRLAPLGRIEKPFPIHLILMPFVGSSLEEPLGADLMGVRGVSGLGVFCWPLRREPRLQMKTEPRRLEGVRLASPAEAEHLLWDELLRGCHHSSPQKLWRNEQTPEG